MMNQVMSDNQRSFFTDPETKAILEKLLNSPNFKKLSQMVAEKEMQSRPDTTPQKQEEEFKKVLQMDLSNTVVGLKETQAIKRLQETMQQMLEEMQNLTEEDLKGGIVEDYIILKREYGLA